MRCHRRIRSGASKFIIFFSRSRPGMRLTIGTPNGMLKESCPQLGKKSPPPQCGFVGFHLNKDSMGRHAIRRKGNVIPVQNSLECQVF